MKSSEVISIRGARVHNLKNISLDIPRNKLIVITGLSGSGKSSLAFDTIYAESERRFVESLSPYARQFLGIEERPDVDRIEGLSPAIAIDQKSVIKNPRSTVGTITEIYDYLRLLFSRIGKPFCPSCGKPVKSQSASEIVTQVLKLPKKSEIVLLAPLLESKKGEHLGILEEVRRGGFTRVRLGGEVIRLEEALSQKLDPKKKHTIEVVIDRFSIDSDLERSRVLDSVETALKVGKGRIKVVTSNKRQETSHEVMFSEQLACADCGISMPPIEPRLFSFNSPYGACAYCTGIGSTLEADSDRVIPNKDLSLAEGAIFPWSRASHRVGRQSWYWWMLSDLAERYKFSLDVPVGKLSSSVMNIILYGENSARSEKQNSIRQLANKIQNSESVFEGVIPNLKRRWKETDSEWARSEIERFMTLKPCPVCKGRRLKSEALSIRIEGNSIADISAFPIHDCQRFFENFGRIKLNKGHAQVARPLIKEILARLGFLLTVGLDYLTLDRESTTLAGGESQRIKLATQIGSKLVGVTYILDEPSVGLHPRDHARLIKTLKELRDLGNTIIVVEHDAQTILEADWVIDLGLGAGVHGGEVIFQGTPQALLKAHTLTSDYLVGRKKVKTRKDEARNTSPQLPNHPQTQNSNEQNYLVIKGAREHNLKNVTVKIPLGKFVCVSGVSGSGKSTLVNDVLAISAMKRFYSSHVTPGQHDRIEGFQYLDKVVVVDQSPIGRTPRSNPATYTGTFGPIRDLFSATHESRARGYNSGRFSFNVKGGRCEACEGQGVKKIEMYFLPDMYVECEVCHGKRYNREALEISWNGRDISEVLEMSVEGALKFFAKIPQIQSKLDTIRQVGLGYIKLGQAATTLSGGEAQRVKLATELSKRATGKTLYILDEPTTGLHFHDIQRLLDVLKALVDKGNTVLVIEHNLDVLENADYVIDLGPEGGEGGGKVIACGNPQELSRIPGSFTGQFLAKAFKRS